MPPQKYSTGAVRSLPPGQERSYHSPKVRSREKKPYKVPVDKVLRQAAIPSVPWRVPSRLYSHGVVGLHEEIEDFYNWITPSAAETRQRQHVVDQVSQLIRRLYPHARVDVFGSFATGLYLPSSDLDLIVFGKWSQLPFYTMQDELIKAGICHRDGVKILDKATVPILKIIHQATELKVDISFNMVNGLHTAKLIAGFTQRYSSLPKLFLLLKHFLYQRDLNEVFTGGISSYALILMLISFLQMNPRIPTNDDRGLNLGVLLLEFLELYGRHFNYQETTIRVRGSGSYINKSMMRQMMPHGQSPSLLSIEDPVQAGNDICRSCYGAMQVKQAFEYAYSVLSRAVLDPGRTNNGVLQRVLQVSKEDVDYRLWVQGRF